MKWVTRKGVRLDRSACVWLITNFLDSDPEIAYAEASDLREAAANGARVFHDTVSEDATTRERTSFQELLARSERTRRDPALTFMGDILYGAEMKEPDSVEEAEGLRAIAKGMSRLARSDQEMVEKMSVVFDALYVYCKGRVEGDYTYGNNT
jgi:hypothetical protein